MYNKFKLPKYVSAAANIPGGEDVIEARLFWDVR